MRWPLFWRPQVDEPLYDIRIVSWQVWNFSFFFEHQWKIQDFGSAKGDPHVTRQFPNSCSASRRLRSAYLKRWRPNRCGHPLCFVVGEKKIGHVRWELSMIVSATSRSPARKRTLGYEKNEKKPSMLLRNVGVSKNRGTPKSSILIGFSIINHPFWGIRIVLFNGYSDSPFQQVALPVEAYVLLPSGSEAPSDCVGTPDVWYICGLGLAELAESVFFFRWECEADRKNMKQTFWSRLSRHGICFAVSIFLKTFFFLWSILGMLQFHLCILWMGKDYQRMMWSLMIIRGWFMPLPA